MFSLCHVNYSLPTLFKNCEYYFSVKCKFREIGIRHATYSFTLKPTSMAHTVSREDNVWPAGVYFLYNRIIAEQCYNGLYIACDCVTTYETFLVTLTFSSLIGARAPITNYRYRGERDTHSILVSMRLNCTL